MQYKCYQCNKDGRVLRFKDIHDHFTSMHETIAPQENKNWCKMNQQIKDPPKDSLGLKEEDVKAKKNIYCPECETYFRKDRFEAATKKPIPRIPNGCVITLTCQSCQGQSKQKKKLDGLNSRTNQSDKQNTHSQKKNKQANDESLDQSSQESQEEIKSPQRSRKRDGPQTARKNTRKFTKKSPSSEIEDEDHNDQLLNKRYHREAFSSSDESKKGKDDTLAQVQNKVKELEEQVTMLQQKVAKKNQYIMKLEAESQKYKNELDSLKQKGTGFGQMGIIQNFSGSFNERGKDTPTFHSKINESESVINQENQKRKQWPEDFIFDLAELPDERYNYLKEYRFNSKSFDSLNYDLNDESKQKSEFFTNDEIINEFYKMIQDQNDKQEIILQTSHFLQDFYQKLTNPSQEKRFTKLMENTICKTKFMMFPIHDPGLKHWTTLLIDFENKSMHYFDTIPEIRKNPKIGLFDKEVKALLKQLNYDPETFENLKTQPVADQKNGYDCGVLTCYLAYAFSLKLDIDDMINFQWDPNYSQQYRKALAIAVSEGEFDAIEAVLEAKRGNS